MNDDKKVKEVYPGDTVTTKENGVYVVYGIMMGDKLPSLEQVKELMQPFYPAHTYLKVCRFGDIVGYEAPKDGAYGDDSIFWGT